MNSKKRVVLLDLDECLGSFGAASAFFYYIHKERNFKSHPFQYEEITYLAKQLIRPCIRPGVLQFLKKLYRNREYIDVILFTNHCNDSFLPFLQNCLNYLITGKARIYRNPSRFFKDWYTREDTRRKTTPIKNIREILKVSYPNISTKSISAIMFDDTPEKIIANDTTQKVITVPMYDRDPPYTVFASAWKHIMNTPFPSKEELEEIDEDFAYCEQEELSSKKIKEESFITFEYFDEPYTRWFTQTESDGENDDDNS